MGKEITRRAFLSTIAAAAVLPGCESKPATPAELAQRYQEKNNPTDPKNLFNILKRTEFMNQDGETVVVDALKARLQNRFATLTFGFGNCGQTCPTTNKNLGKIGRMGGNLTSIIISVDPERDNADTAAREQYKTKLKGYGVTHEVIILCPKSARDAIKLQAEMDAIVNSANPSVHEANIFLYAPGGRQLDKIWGMSKPEVFEKKWQPILDGSQIKR